MFDLRVIPKRLAVLGGGPIGIEMAQAFASLGSQVVVVQSRDRILPRDDAELALRLQSILERQGIRILTKAKTVVVERRGGEKLLRIEHSSRTEEISVDEILVATGRTPNTSMNLEAAGVAFGDNGINVNAKMQTTAKHIYACGDIVGPHRFTHMAGYQAGVVVANAIFRFPKKISDRAIPWCTFTDPELAHVGMTNAEADAKGMARSAITLELAKCDRAVCDSAEGMVKIVLDKRDRVLGAQILAPRAGEMIHEFALLISAGTKLAALRDTIHCYPTYSDAVKQAVSEVYRPRVFSNRTRTVVRWIKWLLG